MVSTSWLTSCRTMEDIRKMSTIHIMIAQHPAPPTPHPTNPTSTPRPTAAAQKPQKREVPVPKIFKAKRKKTSPMAMPRGPGRRNKNRDTLQRESPRSALQKRCSKIFAKSYRKTSVREPFFKKGFRL